MTTPTTVVYVGGIGRSGSTLLARLLERHRGTCGAGEITHLWTRGVEANERCGCGTPFATCDFWQQVGQRAFGGWDSPAALRARDLQPRVDRNRYVPWMICPGISRRYRSIMDEYVTTLSRLYQAIAYVSGCAVVVDTSKHASTAFLLRRAHGIDLRVLHLIRDVRGVAYSWSKRVLRPEIESEAYMSQLGSLRLAIRWLGYNVLFHVLALCGVQTRRLRYEHLALDPYSALSKVAAITGLSDMPPAETGDGKLLLDSSHSIGGNPMRFQTGAVAVRPDEEWREALSMRERLVLATVTWPLRLAYALMQNTPTSHRPGRAHPGETPSEGAARSLPEAPVPGTQQRRRPSPSVSVVIPTYDRPLLLRRAIASVLDQRYDGAIEVVVVHDDGKPNPSLNCELSGRRVLTVSNVRTPGLPGARNTGLRIASGELLAFCDDDDAWMPDKLARQVARLLSIPDAVLSTTGVIIEYGRRSVARVLDHPELTYEALLRDRVTTAHPSTFLFRREDFEHRIHEIDEAIPGGYGEDYDCLLRAARCGLIDVVREPLVDVRWGTTSFFADRWNVMIGAIDYLIAKHPDLLIHPCGLARLYGRKAVAYAALGQQTAASAWAHRTLELNRRERRAYVALAVARGLISVESVMRAAHFTGRGI